MATYVCAGLPEVATALAALTGEPPSVGDPLPRRACMTFRRMRLNVVEFSGRTRHGRSCLLPSPDDAPDALGSGESNEASLS